MSLYKRKDSSVWWVKLSVNGRRLQKSTGTDDRKAAQEYHDRLKTELWEQSRLGVKPGYLWQEAVVRWLVETEHKASQHTDKIRLRWLDAYLRDMPLKDINRDKLDQLVNAKKAEGVANATINRTLALVRSILRRAMHEWEWLDSMPKVRLLPETQAADSLSDGRGSETAPCGVAGAPGGNGALQSGNGPAAIECHRTALVPS